MIERVTSPIDNTKYSINAGNMNEGNFLEKTWRWLVQQDQAFPDYVNLINYFIFMIFFGWLFV